MKTLAFPRELSWPKPTSRVPKGSPNDLFAEAIGLESTVTKLSKLVAKNVSECPTCEQEISLSDMQALIEASNDKADNLRSKGMQIALSMVTKESKGWIEGSDPRKTEANLKAVLATYADLESLKEEIAELRVEEAEKQEVLEDLGKPSSPDELKGKKKAVAADVAANEEEVNSLRSTLRLFERLEDLDQLVSGIDLDSLEEKEADLQKKKNIATRKLEEFSEAKGEINTLAGQGKEIEKQIKYVENKLSEHAENALKIATYEKEYVPYFNALRAGKVHSCAGVLEGVLPVYVGAMASSQYVGAELKLNISEDLKQMDLHLKTGRHEPWLNAVQTSGGQRKRFTLAIITALREVTPRRANVMFFDEPFSDLQPEGKEVFVNRLLPVLMERCEDLTSVFVIAHDHEVVQNANDAFDSVWTAEKDEQGSRLVLDQKLAWVA